MTVSGLKQEPRPVTLEPKPLPYLQQLNNNSAQVLDNNNAVGVDHHHHGVGVGGGAGLVHLSAVEKQEPLDSKDPLRDATIDNDHLATSNRQHEGGNNSPRSNTNGGGEVPQNSYYSH